ncbi:MAG: MATE family efflux transporter, partial [Acidobacteria bacterium]
MTMSELRSELRRLFSLAFPLAAAEAGTQVMSLVDMAVIGRLGGLELAAAGLANAVYFGISVFGLGLMLGVDPLISQAVGARDFSRARRVMWQGIWLALITAALLTILLLCGPLLLRAIGVKPEIVRPASIFLLIRTIGLSPWLVFFVIRAYLQAHHVTRPMVTSMIIANVLNLIIDIVLVFGFGPIPALGVAGAAISTVS